MGRFVDTVTLENMQDWFSQFGNTDVHYLNSSFPRFQATYEFVRPALAAGQMTIMDIGAHWLHHSFFYANDGHKLVCADVPGSISDPSTRQIAAAFGADLIFYRRLDLAESIRDVPENSIDLVIFTEILEHIAFNPIPLWDAIYKMMKPGGKVFLTTPNAMYFKSVIARLNDLIHSHCLGISVQDILEVGTYGHHWKEYSIPEIKNYFSRLSPDFAIGRVETWSETASDDDELAVELEGFGKEANAHPATDKVLVREMLAHLHARGTQLTGRNIFMEITLPEKSAGITIRPPWLPD